MPKLSLESLVALRVAHLGMVQGIITRMSGYSATAKNFAVTACVAIIALAADQASPEIALLAIPALVAFLCMDGYYLSLEKRYRTLYDGVAVQIDRLRVRHVAESAQFFSSYLEKHAAKLVSVAVLCSYIVRVGIFVYCAC